MKRISINLLTNVLLLLLGLVLIVFYSVTDVLRWVAMVAGALFALPSLVYLYKVMKRRADVRASTDYLGVVPAVGGLCFGIVMLSKPGLFVPVVALLMGVLLVVLGLFHIVYLLLSRRVMGVSGWYFVAPLLVVTGGALILFSPELREQGGSVALLTGLELLLFNFTSLQEHFAEQRQRKAAATDTGADTDNQAEIIDTSVAPETHSEPHYEL